MIQPYDFTICGQLSLSSLRLNRQQNQPKSSEHWLWFSSNTPLYDKTLLKMFTNEVIF